MFARQRFTITHDGGTLMRGMDPNDRMTQVFFDIQRGLPRQGPGDDESTLRALAMCAELPARPDVLDVGCGPGMQTIALARALDGRITAGDLHQEFLDQLVESAVAAGVRDRIGQMRLDMVDLPFGRDSFDLIWSEGAAYILGFGEAFSRWRWALRTRGYMAVTELTWLVPGPPAEAADFFAAEYPAMAEVAANVAAIEERGYDVMGHFTLPDAAWWDHYYTPLEAKLPGLRAKYADDDEAMGLVEMTAREINVRRHFGDTYGYEFFVARAADPDVAPPRNPAPSSEAQPADEPPSEGSPQPQFPPPLD
jgi:SAM-dependent methyltransferase